MPLETQTSPTPPPSLSWSVLEFQPQDRHPDWLWYTGLVFGIAATVSFFYGNIFFGIFLVVAGACVILFAQRAPQMMVVTFNEKDVLVDKTLITYDRITQFWIDETGKPDKLLMLVKGHIVPMMTIPLGGVTAATVRTEMTKHAPEVTMREPLGIKIAERLGF